ncbi:caspase family protein [Actinoplanes sp. NPDC048796]|uniref:caspase family protein n=1 Tax=unclassified Actinoplanes TaxID=2626549 RepID=UPI00340F153D
MTRLPDPLTSRAFLFGTSSYRDPTGNLKAITQVEENVAELADILTDPLLGGLSEANCEVLLNEPDLGVLGRRLEDAAKAARDTLVIYYSGHGWPSGGGSLYLAQPNSHWDYMRRTAMPYEWIVEACAESPARNKVIILDCCFSGRALRPFHLSGGDAELAAQIDIRGAFIMASSAASSVSEFAVDERHTAFTGELVTLLRHGIPGAPRLIELNGLFLELAQRLIARSLPQPQQGGSGTAHRLALTQNASYVTSGPNVGDSDGNAVPSRRIIANGSLKGPGNAGALARPRKPTPVIIDEFPDHHQFHEPVSYTKYCFVDGGGDLRSAEESARIHWDNFSRYLEAVAQYCVGSAWTADRPNLDQLVTQSYEWRRLIPRVDALGRRIEAHYQKRARLFPAQFVHEINGLVDDVDNLLRSHYRGLPVFSGLRGSAGRMATRRKILSIAEENRAWYYYYLRQLAEFCVELDPEATHDDVAKTLHEILPAYAVFEKRIHDFESEQARTVPENRSAARDHLARNHRFLCGIVKEIDVCFRLGVLEGAF